MDQDVSYLNIWTIQKMKILAVKNVQLQIRLKKAKKESIYIF